MARHHLRYFLAITLQVRARLSAELQRCGCLQLCQEAGSESRGPGGAAEAPAQPGGVPAGCHQVAASVSVTEVSGAGGTGGNITGNEVRQPEDWAACGNPFLFLRIRISLCV